MRALVLAATSVLLLLASCRIPSRLEGRWRGVRAEGVPAEMQAAANVFATGVHLEIRGNRLTVTTPKETQTGTFRVVQDTATSVVIATDKEDGDETFDVIDDRTLRWQVAPPRAITFKRE
jgi:hypothetical protein